MYTEAKKIPENFFPWYHLACFFKMKIFKKIFLAKTHQKIQKHFLQNDQKKTQKNSSIFFYNIKSGTSGKNFQVFFQLQYAHQNTKMDKFLTGHFFGPRGSISSTVHDICVFFFLFRFSQNLVPLQSNFESSQQRSTSQSRQRDDISSRVNLI